MTETKTESVTLAHHADAKRVRLGHSPACRDIRGGELVFQLRHLRRRTFRPACAKPGERRQGLSHTLCGFQQVGRLRRHAEKTGHAFAVDHAHRFFGVPLV